MSEDRQDPRHLTDDDLNRIEPFLEVENDTELFQCACIMMNTFEEGATETQILEYKL